MPKSISVAYFQDKTEPIIFIFKSQGYKIFQKERGSSAALAQAEHAHVAVLRNTNLSHCHQIMQHWKQKQYVKIQAGSGVIPEFFPFLWP